jgi:uncharacterized membrane protein YccC
VKGPGIAMGIWRDATRVDPAGIEIGFGVRCAIGVAIPLVVGLAVGQPLAGAAGAIGALPVGFASRQGVYRTRATAALLTAAAVAVSAFVGALCGANVWLSVAAAVIWAFSYGVLTSLGTTAMVIGVNSVVTLAIFGQFHDSPAQAAVAAALVFAGGVVQTLLLVTVWPLARFKRERDVLAAAYRTLGEYAAHFPASRLRAPAATTLAALSETLADPQPFGSRGEIAAFEALLAEAERSRGSLATLAEDRYLFEAHAEPELARAIGLVGEASAAVLLEIAAALASARAPTSDDAMWTAFDEPLATLHGAQSQAGVQRAARDAEALLGQLRSAWRAATTPAEVPERTAARAPRILKPSAIPEALATLRANLTFRSGFAHHGIRLAVVLGIATLAAHVLPLGRGYWIALTAAIVLRNDFQSTFTRGVARVIGTLAGAVVASIVAFFVHPYPPTLVVLAIAFAFGAFVLFNVNYALFTMSITGYVIFLLALGGLPEHSALVSRVEETLLGGALALAAYALWPTWERTLVPERLADLLARQRIHARLLLAAYADPANADDGAIRHAQRESWLARSNAESSVDRMLAEPVRPRAITVRAALGILAASRRFGIAMLGLYARLSRSNAVTTSRLPTLANEIDASFAILEDALRRHEDPVPLPQLRDAQIALRARLEETPGGDDSSLGADTDLMVDSLNTIAHVLHRLRESEAAPNPASPTS